MHRTTIPPIHKPFQIMGVQRTTATYMSLFSSWTRQQYSSSINKSLGEAGGLVQRHPLTDELNRYAAKPTALCDARPGSHRYISLFSGSDVPTIRSSPTNHWFGLQGTGRSRMSWNRYAAPGENPTRRTCLLPPAIGALETREHRLRHLPAPYPAVKPLLMLLPGPQGQRASTYHQALGCESTFCYSLWAHRAHCMRRFER
jgi:hypothetical protein